MENFANFNKVYDKAVKLLSLRLHTVSELRHKLIRYKYDNDTIRAVLDKLIELKVLDDERFAQIFLENLIRFKTFGYFGLKAKLLSKGITSKDAERLLSENLSLEEEVKIAQKIMAKKNGDPKKLAISLQRKGFRSEVIVRVLKNHDFMVQ